jgi:hypothetical protein
LSGWVRSPAIFWPIDLTKTAKPSRLELRESRALAFNLLNPNIISSSPGFGSRLAITTSGITVKVQNLAVAKLEAGSK